MTTVQKQEIANVSKYAVYTNKALNETYKLRGVSDLGKAWNMVEFVCRRNNWNPIDIKVSFFNK